MSTSGHVPTLVSLVASYRAALDATTAAFQASLEVMRREIPGGVGGFATAASSTPGLFHEYTLLADTWGESVGREERATEAGARCHAAAQAHRAKCLALTAARDAIVAHVAARTGGSVDAVSIACVLVDEWKSSS